MVELRSLARALGGKVSGKTVRAPGPGHSRADASLVVWLDNSAPEGFRVHSHSGDDWRTCADYVRNALGLPSWSPTRPSPAPARARSARANHGNNGDRALGIWREARDPRGTVVEQYLAARGLTLPSDFAGRVIRYHPHLWHADSKQQMQGMVALFRDIHSDEPCGIHRTWLDQGQKIGRKMLGRARGAAIKLTADDAVTLGLGITEGIEDGLAVMLTGWTPVWVGTSAGAIERFPVLSGIEALTLFADADRVGMKAANACTARWRAAGREVAILPPQSHGGGHG